MPELFRLAFEAYSGPSSLFVGAWASSRRDHRELDDVLHVAIRDGNPGAMRIYANKALAPQSGQRCEHVCN